MVLIYSSIGVVVLTGAGGVGFLVPVFDEIWNLLDGKWFCVEVTLREVAAQTEQDSFLLAGFDAFGQHFDVQAVSQGNDAFDERLFRITLDQFIDKHSVDLDLGQDVAELLDVAQR